MNDHLKKMVELLLAGQLYTDDATHTPDGIGGAVITATLVRSDGQEYRVFASSMDETWMMLDDDDTEHTVPVNVQHELTRLVETAMVS